MSDTPIDTFYVLAQVAETPQPIAACQYFLDPECTQQVYSPLSSSKSTGQALFVQAASCSLVLMGAVFKTIGATPVLRSQNFVAAVPSEADPALFQVTVPMPTDSETTKGVVLMFSTPDAVQSLYPSADPQVANTRDP